AVIAARDRHAVAVHPALVHGAPPSTHTSVSQHRRFPITEAMSRILRLRSYLDQASASLFPSSSDCGVSYGRMPSSRVNLRPREGTAEGIAQARPQRYEPAQSH